MKGKNQNAPLLPVIRRRGARGTRKNSPKGIIYILKTNNKYKADYITAVNEKCRVAEAKKRLRNRRIVCFGLAFLLTVGVLSVVIPNKPKKSSIPSGDANVTVNTSSEEEASKPTASVEEIPVKEIVYADTNSVTNVEIAFSLDVGEILYHTDVKIEDGKLYHVYLDVDLPLAWITPDSHYPEYRTDVD